MTTEKYDLPLNLKSLKESHAPLKLEKVVKSKFYGSKSVQTYSHYKPISKLFIMKF